MVLSKTSSESDVSVHSTFASRYVRTSLPRFEMAENSIPKEAAFQIINDELMLDGNPRLNLASFVTTWMEPECDKLMMDSINKNYVDMDEYPVTTELQNRCVNMIARLFNAPLEEEETAIGVGTVGSSEAIMLAGLAFKRIWQNKRKAEGKPHDKPNIVTGANVQVCWEKFANYFEVELKEVKLREGYYVMEPVKAVEMVDENTICVAAILGSTLNGEFEDVKLLNDLLIEKNKLTGWNTPIHVDAASGGFIAPFLYPELEWDFRLPLVKSINVSGHKYGLVYAGIGWVIWRTKQDLPEELIFHINYLGADQPTFTLNFSKGSSQVIAQYYQLIRLGYEGYRNVMENCRENAIVLREGLEKTGRFNIVSKDEGVPLVAFSLKDNSHHNEFEVSETLRRFGWIVPAYTMPADAQHVTVLRVVIREDFSRTLAERLVLDIVKVLHELDTLPARLSAMKPPKNHHKQHQLQTQQIPKPKAKPITEILWVSLVATCIKLLLIPAYHSTDFEVHRNWLAITHSLPLSQWYSDQTSPWTLDYPPFFAHFEHFLSFFSSLVDPIMVHLHHGLNYKSLPTIYFQRLTVIISDFVLVFGIYRLTRNLGYKERVLIWCLVIFSPGLMIVDHLHFQYNGFLLGMLLISISALEEWKDLLGGFVFAVLLCFKHLFAVGAPVYFVYLLRHYCRGGFIRGFGRLVIMGSAVVAVFAAAYGPFLYHGQIQQVFYRMFPFGRGLCHAYWAPNFWVFYIILDKVLSFSLVKMGFNVQAPTASFTGGLVGDSSPFAVLPRVTPMITFGFVLLAIAPCVIKAWRDPQPRMITRWIAYAYTCGFMFGWHVHEKASLHFVIPLAIIALKSAEDAKHYFYLSIVSCYSLFPLLFEAQEYPIKVLLLLLHASLMWIGFSSHFATTARKTAESEQKRYDKTRFVIGWFGKLYLVGLPAVEIYGQLVHPILFAESLPFLPLMLISIYCAFGMMYSWMWQLRQIIKLH